MNDALAAVLNTLWQSAALAGAIWLAFRLARTTNAATRHAIWWAALAVVVLLPLIPTRTAAPPPAPLLVRYSPVDLAPAPVGPRQPLAPITPERGPLELPAGSWTGLLFSAWA